MLDDMDYPRLTPAEARKRFGRLTAAMSGSYREFETAEGLWRPEFDDRVRLVGYRLYPAPTTSDQKPASVLFRRRRR